MGSAGSLCTLLRPRESVLGNPAVGQRVCLQGDARPYTGCRQSLRQPGMGWAQRNPHVDHPKLVATSPARDSPALASFCSPSPLASELHVSNKRWPSVPTRAAFSENKKPAITILPRALTTQSSCEHSSCFANPFRGAGHIHQQRAHGPA